MDIVTRRVLTMRSVMRCGAYPTCTVAEIIVADYASHLRELYYTRQEIDFTDEVKAAASIFVTIPKPGVSEEAWVENRRLVTDHKRASMTEDEWMHHCASRRKSARIRRGNYAVMDIQQNKATKGQMQAINHGRAHWEERSR